MPSAREIYLSTRKKHDQLWNTYVVRPLASPVVAVLTGTPVTPNQLTFFNLAVFIIGSVMLVTMPGALGGLLAIVVLELSYLFDCADGMLARAKKLASPTGHLLDFLTDEIKAFLLVGALSIRLWRSGGWGLDVSGWAAGDVRYLLAGVVGLIVVASAISMTTFVRRPEYTGKATPTHAHHESALAGASSTSLAALAMTFLRFLNHYPSHIWIFAALDRLDVFFWMYLFLNLLYLGRTGLSVLLRLGGPGAYPKTRAGASE